MTKTVDHPTGNQGTLVPKRVLPGAGPLVAEGKSSLARGASTGDPAAISELLGQARPMVHQWALRMTKNPDDAEDVTQIVLLRVWSGISSFRGESKLSSWLYRITKNEVADFRRKETRRELLFSERVFPEKWASPRVSEPVRLHSSQACELVRDVACALPPLQLAAFRLIDLDGLRPCEAAKVLGRTQANTRSSLCRARLKIRELALQAREELFEDL